MLFARCTPKGPFHKDAQRCVQTLLTSKPNQPPLLGPGLSYLEVSVPGIAAMFGITFCQQCNINRNLYP